MAIPDDTHKIAERPVHSAFDAPPHIPQPGFSYPMAPFLVPDDCQAPEEPTAGYNHHVNSPRRTLEEWSRILTTCTGTLSPLEWRCMLDSLHDGSNVDLKTLLKLQFVTIELLISQGEELEHEVQELRQNNQELRQHNQELRQNNYHLQGEYKVIQQDLEQELDSYKQMFRELFGGME